MDMVLCKSSSRAKDEKDEEKKRGTLSHKSVERDRRLPPPPLGYRAMEGNDGGERQKKKRKRL
jgi:hypothetical protein